MATPRRYMQHHHSDSGAGIGAKYYQKATNNKNIGRTNDCFFFLKLGAGIFFVLGILKFLLFTEPLTLEDLSPFKNVTMVEFSTKDYGSFVMELYPSHAPRTVDFFLRNIREGFYTKKQVAGFYRSETNHLLQAGGFIHDAHTTRGIPIEYSLPSTERTVVMARQRNAKSGGTEFAIMLQDNSVSNQPSTVDGNPGYTTFGRVFEGWPTILKIAKKLPQGFLKKEDKDSVIYFNAAKTVMRQVPTEKNLQEAFYGVKAHVEEPFSVVMFSKTTCPFCKRAKEILKKVGAQVHIVELDLLSNGPLYQDALEALTGRRTVPNVFINGKTIGGGDDTQRLYKSGELEKMLRNAGALAKSFILRTIKEKPLVVFSKSYCPFCRKAKAALGSLGASPASFELDMRPDGEALQYYLQQLTGSSTVPQVFIGGKMIGGGDDTARLKESGELLLLLQKAKAIK